jgi:hypothetical protein
MFRAQCDQLDIGNFFLEDMQQHDSKTLSKQTVHFIRALKEELGFSTVIPHGKTFSEMKASAALGCELCQVIVGQYNRRSIAPAADAEMFCSLNTLHSPLVPDRVIHHPNTSGPKHVMGLVFLMGLVFQSCFSTIYSGA